MKAGGSSAPAPSTTVAPATPTDGAPDAAAPPPVTTTTPPPPPVKIMVVGDSFATSVVVGLNNTAKATGQIAVLNGAIIGCGFGRGGSNKALNIPLTYNPVCLKRDASLTDELNSFHPDVVVAAGGMWDASDRKLAGTRTWVHFGVPAYDAYFTGEVQHLADLLQSTGAQLVWLNSPDWKPVYNPSLFMKPGPYSESDNARVDDFNRIVAAVLAGRPRAQMLDLKAWLEAQPGGQFAPTLRADGVHFNMGSTDQAAAWLVPQLLTIVRGAPAG